MRLAIRICGIVAVVFLIVGVIGFIVGSGFMCFDVCPSPSAFPGAALRQAGIAFGPGLLLALVTWALFLTALTRAGMGRGLFIAIGVPVLLVAVLILVLAFISPAALLPSTAAEYGAWVDTLVAAWLVTLILIVLMLVLAPPSAVRAGTP